MLYNAKLFLGSIGLAASLVSGQSVAQDASSNFAGCMSWNQESTPRASELGEAIKCLADKVDILESELKPFKAARGAVVAFDRNRNTEAVCPRGWTYFHPAGGRFMVGAGEHENGLTEYPSYDEDNTQSVGGEETHTLSSQEVFKHSHTVNAVTLKEFYGKTAGLQAGNTSQTALLVPNELSKVKSPTQITGAIRWEYAPQ